MVQRGVAGARECVGGTQHNDEEVGAHGLSCVCGVGGVVALGLAARLGSGKEVPLCKASGHRRPARFQVGASCIISIFGPNVSRIPRTHVARRRGRTDARAVVGSREAWSNVSSRSLSSAVHDSKQPTPCQRADTSGRHRCWLQYSGASFTHLPAVHSAECPPPTRRRPRMKSRQGSPWSVRRSMSTF
eukprot:scaffold66691_cov58-Phaeocystis_antarctica.AAC.2